LVVDATVNREAIGALKCPNRAASLVANHSINRPAIIASSCETILHFDNYVTGAAPIIFIPPPRAVIVEIGRCAVVGITKAIPVGVTETIRIEPGIIVARVKAMVVVAPVPVMAAAPTATMIPLGPMVRPAPMKARSIAGRTSMSRLGRSR